MIIEDLQAELKEAADHAETLTTVMVATDKERSELQAELTDARETIRQSNMAKGNLKRSKEANERKDADIKELKGSWWLGKRNSRQPRRATTV